MEKRSKDTKNTTKNNKKKMSGMMAKIVTPVAAMALVTLVTVSGLRMAVQNLYNQGMMISEQIVSCVDAAGALDTDYTKMQSYTSNVIHEPSEQTIGGYSDALDQAYGRMVKNIEVFKKYANASKEKETVLDLHEKLKGMYDYQQAQMQNAVYGTEIPEEVLAAESGYNTGILSDISELEKMIQADEKEAKAALKQAKILSNIVIAGSIAFTVLIFIIVVLISVRLIVTPVKKSSKELGDMVDEVNNAAADLTKRISVNQKDEIGSLVEGVNTFIEALQNVIAKIRDSSVHLNSTFAAVTDSVTSVNGNATDISAVMEELSATMEEVSATLANVNERVEKAGTGMDRISEQSEHILTYATEMQDRATQLEDTAVSNKDTTSAMIQEILGTLQQAIENSRSVEEVNALTDEILNISSQTNLLALNASIESARAGEAGRGFAVVADEIRQLAERTKQETEEISKISDDLTENATRAANAVSQSVSATDAQDVMITEASESFEAMNDNVTELITHIENIDDRLSRLSEANNQIVDNITNLSATTEEVTASSNQAAELSNANMENAESAKNQLTGVLDVSHQLDKYL